MFRHHLKEVIAEKESKLEIKKVEERLRLDLKDNIKQIKPLIDENSGKIENMCQNLRRKENKIELLSTQIEDVLKENDAPSTTISDQMEDKLKGIYKQLESKVCKKSLSEKKNKIQKILILLKKILIQK